MRGASLAKPKHMVIVTDEPRAEQFHLVSRAGTGFRVIYQQCEPRCGARLQFLSSADPAIN